ncbi:SDR family NAD(P)-dependent oxidoreductase [Candidatus Palauibacter polyketidifaciens]|uniref:SDR family NAD(P)-dependent oxidoreductase n=1 Tax=Candidatus Palauibacter polyketidifaciens TaxID=3056740 RepID=UPI002382BC95|nr:SDR family NAD(P)-dependent oxidoreductase [Candidatus Palauibacter polyketidifaciens]MDE2720070.1 SDR family NAD(P)-dependent oxidoreductase [Candidatus Palauibacter polyketidifaciens]
MSLAGRGALITGGGRGIGAATARTLADRGVRLVLAARSTPEIEAVAAELRDRGGEAWAATCDVSDPASVEALCREAANRLGAVDILVNNAGVASSAPVVKLALEEWERLWRINATGALLAMQGVLPGMVERGWGRIVNVASVAALRGGRYMGGYAASKHALVGLTRSAAAEVARAGVTVNAVCPGYVDTPMTDATIENIVKRTDMEETDAVEAILATTPQRRLIAPGEVAASIAFLCEDEALSINGQTVVLDGGATSALQ